jgi:membrane fusion protein, multidrug efflux system
MTQAAVEHGEAGQEVLPERTAPREREAGAASPDARPEESPRRKGASALLRKRGRALLWIAAAAAVAAVAAVFGLRYLASFESTDDAQVDGNASAIASRVAGTVVAVHVQDNERVKPGDRLVDLDRADYRVALEQATANLDQARFQRLAEARANARIAQIDLARSRRLVESGALPREDLDTRQATADAREAEVAASQAAVDAAQAAVDQARLDLDYTQLRSPVAGIVAQRQVNIGDRVQPAQQLMAIVQVDDLWITANFKESQLRHIRPGQRADVHVDALGQTFRGYVESLPAATGVRFSLLPPENATGNYVKVVQRLPVRIRLEPGQPNLDRLRPGMSVEPTVWLR